VLNFARCADAGFMAIVPGFGPLGRQI
jgi:hypothetical protein